MIPDNYVDGTLIQPVTDRIAYARPSREAVNMNELAIEEWGKFKAMVQEKFPHYPEDETRAFAYWLFRISGLVVYPKES